MLYLAAEADGYELPLAVAGTQAELAALIGKSRTGVNLAIKRNSRTWIHGTPARIYQIAEEDATLEGGRKL